MGKQYIVTRWETDPDGFFIREFDGENTVGRYSSFLDTDLKEAIAELEKLNGKTMEEL